MLGKDLLKRLLFYFYYCRVDILTNRLETSMHNHIPDLSIFLFLFSADGMMFGPLALCPVCSGHVSFSGGIYRCNGYISEWSKCSHATSDPNRIKGKWKIPEETENQFLVKVNQLLCRVDMGQVRSGGYCIKFIFFL